MGLLEDLRRCYEEETEIPNAYPHGKLYLNVIGITDWQHERILIMEEAVTHLKEEVVVDVFQIPVLAALRTEPDYKAAMARLQNVKAVRLLHVAMGLVTEAGEFTDQLKKHIFYGKPIDEVNLIEELGDSSWYERIGTDALEIKFLDMLQRNIDKLRARFPEKFTEERAENRNLSREREILEGQK